MSKDLRPCEILVFPWQMERPRWRRLRPSKGRVRVEADEVELTRIYHEFGIFVNRSGKYGQECIDMY